MPILTIDWLWPNGDGGARGPDGTYRVPGAVPGDRVRVAGGRRRGSVVEAELVAIEQPSPDRRTPPCAWDAACGGCDLASLAPEARARAMAAALGRLFGQDGPAAWVASPRPTTHRARVKLAIDDGRLGYRAARSHTLVEIGACAVAREPVQAGLVALRALPPGALAGLGTVEIRTDGRRVVYAFESAGRAPDGAALAALGDVAIDGRAVHGDPRLWLSVAGLRLRASPRSFYQVNLDGNEALVAHVRDAIAAVAAERVLDLYAGIGNLTLPIAATGVPVVAVEREGQATADLRVSAAANALDARVRVVERAVEKFDPSSEPFDAVVLDPPRAGAPGVVGTLLRQRPRRIVYVSCHAPSAAQDLKAAGRAGYRVVAVTGFDLFPDTRHFEAVIVLDRPR